MVEKKEVKKVEEVTPKVPPPPAPPDNLTEEGQPGSDEQPRKMSAPRRSSVKNAASEGADFDMEDMDMDEFAQYMGDYEEGQAEGTKQTDLAPGLDLPDDSDYVGHDYRLYRCPYHLT